MKTSNRITKSVFVGAAALAAVAVVPALTGAVPTMDIETVLIEAPGGIANAPDSATGSVHGSVGYDYYIGKYEVTQGQWKDFLNEVAKTDSHGLYNDFMGISASYSGITRSGVSGSYSYSLVNEDYARRPVIFVNLLDAKRFCNWLTTGNTELGLYDMGVGHGNDERDTAAWSANGGVVLPDENEWYKAAYYDPNKGGSGVGGYHEYSTTGSGNTAGDTMDPGYANYNDLYLHGAEGWTYRLSPVEFYKDYASAYGVVDMTGNVSEWIDIPNGSTRVVRGGSCGNTDTGLAAGFSWPHFTPGDELGDLGFRVASLAPIPEPSTYGVIGGALVGLLYLLGRKRRAVAP
ncbi:MAG: formylglycine-generating enzyme family protein [Puniceicoccales bacterium]|jgi:formylglycine-generating enzyme required for sulfatase activity|nr:formylglycine-generating enzyme family protein [Puniceicoccales bacterium]